MNRGRSMTRAPYKGKGREDSSASVDLEKGDISAADDPEKAAADFYAQEGAQGKNSTPF